jgi:tetratricopeptide (TPR) repeat protein
MFNALEKVISRRPMPAVGLLGLLSTAGKAVRGRPKTTGLILAVLALAGTGAGFYAYALRQWQAAQVAVKESRLEDAKTNLDFCLFVWPRSVQVHILAARAARLRGAFSEAEAYLNRCLMLEHGATEPVQVELLLMRVQRGEEDDVALELLQRVDDGSPEAPLILETLARAYMFYLRYGQAFMCLSRWMEVAPDSAEPVRLRGWVLERLNDHEGAMEDYKRALELDPGLVPARLRLAELYLEKSNPIEALQHLDLLRKQFTDRPDIKARLGECRFLQGEHEEARRLLEEAVEQLPNDPGVLIHLTKLEMQEGHPDKAEQWVRRALKVDPTDTEAEFTLVAALQSQGRWDEANAALEQYRKDTALLRRVAKVLHEEAEHPSTDPDALSELGAAFLRTNERAGLYWLHRALRCDPGHQPTHKVLAEHYESKGEPEKAASYRAQLKPDKKAASP